MMETQRPYAKPSYGPPIHAHHQHVNQHQPPSVNTFSTISSMGGMAPSTAYQIGSPVANPRRSTSVKSGGRSSMSASPQPTSYVALLRKQKATVWCDRTQFEDPRMIAQQRAAKRRATLEVIGSNNRNSNTGSTAVAGRTSSLSTSGGFKVAAKIRHHGKPVVVGYAPDTNYVGVGGVPLRLSATEVEGENSEDDEVMTNQKLHHRRTGSSGRSSIASSRRAYGYQSSGALRPTGSTGSTGKRWSPGDTPERTISLAHDNGSNSPSDDPTLGRTQTMKSASDGERADSVPDLGPNAARLASKSLANSTMYREKGPTSTDDLRRRGSVDDRTMTLSSGRLFVANPD